MKRWILGTVIVIAAAFGLMLVLGLVAQALVAGAGKDRVIAALQDAAGVPVSVGNAGFDLAAWFRLKPAIALDNIAIGNPAGFRAPHSIEAKKLSAQVSLLSLLQKNIEVYSIGIESPRILVETGAGGTTNIEQLLKKLSAGGGKGQAPASAPKGSAGTGLAIDKLYVKSGEVVLATGPRAGERINVHDIDLQLSDFQSDRTCQLEVAAKLFRGERSRLHVKGQAGPFGADSLPLAGTLLVAIAPAEIPAAMRKSEFGTLLGAPGAKALATLEATVKGDLYRTVSGPAKLTLADIRLGKDEKHVLPLTGEAPLTFSAGSLTGEPAFELKMAEAKLRLGGGEWLGGAEVHVHGASTRGGSRGRIRNVEINEFLSSLTSSNDKIFGVFEIPSYSMQFAGKNADDLLNSLNGSGRISVSKGRIAALDLLASIQRAMEQGQKETTGAQGVTPFTTLAADFAMAQSKLNLSNIQLDGPGLRVSGQGAITFEQAINFDLQASVSGGVGQLVNRVSGRPQQSEATVPLTVRGTVNSPQVRPNVGKIATGIATGLLDSLFKKKK
jgi:uncharacterized protein involved in outer membrane biogenesis